MQAKRVLPLALLYEAGNKIEGRTRFQKLAFLSDQRLQEEDIDPYDFIAYDYGPFDKDLYKELEWLEEEGLITEKERRTYGGDTRYDYKLTEKGIKSIQHNVPHLDSSDQIGQLSESQKKLKTIFDVAENVVSEYNDMPISNLIKRVYDEYPEYAENSVLY